MQNVQLKSILKKLISERKVTIKEVCKATKVPQATLSSYLSGGGSSKPQHIRALAQYFGVSMEFLLFGEDSTLSLDSQVTEGIFEGWIKVKIERAIKVEKK